MIHSDTFGKNYYMEKGFWENLKINHSNVQQATYEGKEKELKVHAKRIKKQPLFSILRFSINIFFKNLPLSLLKKEKKKKLFAHIFTRNSFRDQQSPVRTQHLHTWTRQKSIR